MSIKKSPDKSATLYKIGTKKIGNDGNTWIIVENKNNVKKWQLYKKIQTPIINDTKKSSKKNSKKISKKNNKKSILNDTIKKNTIKLSNNIYGKPIIKKNNWNKWLENCNSEFINFINKIKYSYTIFNLLKINVVEVIEPPSFNSHWIDQYPHDYAKQNFPQYYKDTNNIIPHIIIRYKIDNNEHLATDYKQMCIEGSILNITKTIKSRLVNYLDINFPKQYFIRNEFENDYTLWFCLKKIPNKNLK